jgi:PPOX class probable F420-dependent enzyme
MSGLAMSREAEDEFLFAGRILRLATINEDGTPHLAPLWYLYENGKIYIHTGAKSVKTKNIQRDGNVSMCVDVGEFLYDIKNVKLRGKAKVVDDETLAKAMAEQLYVKYFGSAAHPQAKEYLSKEADNIVIEIEPRGKRHSQDYSLLRK